MENDPTSCRLRHRLIIYQKNITHQFERPERVLRCYNIKKLIANVLFLPLRNTQTGTRRFPFFISRSVKPQN